MAAFQHGAFSAFSSIKCEKHENQGAVFLMTSNFDIKSFTKHVVFELALKTSPKRTEQRNAMQPRPETEEKALNILE